MNCMPGDVIVFCCSLFWNLMLHDYFASILHDTFRVQSTCSSTVLRCHSDLMEIEAGLRYEQEQTILRWRRFSGAGKGILNRCISRYRSLTVRLLFLFPA
eukprot:752991-Hanusia_phi.AAC.4